MKIFKLFTLFFALFLFSFCHKKKDNTLVTIADPIVTTSAVTNITNSSAFCGGIVTDASNGNIVSRGICWSINQFPSIDDVNDSKIILGSGTGSFSAQMSGFISNKTYYVRAYATNEEGTGYGDDMVFTTSPFATFSYGNKIIYVHPVDNGNSIWGQSGVVTAATSTNNGTDDTQLISNQTGNYAAKACSDLVAYGYSDWYLPSSDELNAMQQNKGAIGNFNQTEYWSSTEINANTAASQNFQTGAASTNQQKNLVKACRCVRKD